MADLVVVAAKQLIPLIEKLFRRPKSGADRMDWAAEAVMAALRHMAKSGEVDKVPSRREVVEVLERVFADQNSTADTAPAPAPAAGGALPPGFDPKESFRNLVSWAHQPGK